MWSFWCQILVRLSIKPAAIADARRKAEVYARAAVMPGRVVSIEEETGLSRRALAQPAGMQMGENTLHATVTVGFKIADK